jgi:hypothetical protein
MSRTLESLSFVSCYVQCTCTLCRRLADRQGSGLTLLNHVSQCGVLQPPCYMVGYQQHKLHTTS